jgi:hypothetical protein
MSADVLLEVAKRLKVGRQSDIRAEPFTRGDDTRQALDRR